MDVKHKLRGMETGNNEGMVRKSRERSHFQHVENGLCASII